jgi:hypothetical protein
LTRVRDANGLTRESKGPDAVRKFIGHLEELINPRRVIFVDTAQPGESADKRYLQTRYTEVIQMCQTQVRPATAQAAVAVLAASSPWIQPPTWQADEKEEAGPDEDEEAGQDEEAEAGQADEVMYSHQAKRATGSVVLQAGVSPPQEFVNDRDKCNYCLKQGHWKHDCPFLGASKLPGQHGRR